MTPLDIVRKDRLAIQYIDNPSYEVQYTAIYNQGNNIKYIKNPDNKIQQYAVNHTGTSIQYIKEPSYEIQLEAVKKDGYSLEYILRQRGDITKLFKLCMIAVNEIGFAVQYIPPNLFSVKEMFELYRIAVKQRGLSIKYIPFYQLKIDQQTLYDNLFIPAVKQDGLALKYILPYMKQEDFDYGLIHEIQIIAVTQNNLALSYVDFISSDLMEIANRTKTKTSVDKMLIDLGIQLDEE